ncbi:MAG: acyl-CoA thioesterase [Saprospiraceae bacterium]|jgi:acyl-CoA hydrolase|nr:acyl-CoA thioesterase [Saprospiraceae bacterium]
MIKNAKTITESRTEMNELVLPNDTNALGNLMGGNLMRWMDIASAICASKHCSSFVVTVSVDHLTFAEPIKLGDVVTITAVATRSFHTSIEIFLEVFTRGILEEKSRKSNQAFFTFVALDERTMRPKLVPEVIPTTDEEKKLFDEAIVRREMRLVLSGKMKPSDAKISLDFLNK